MPYLTARIVVATVAVFAMGSLALPSSVAADSSCVPGPRADCSGANLAGMNLARTDLRGIDLSDATLTGADLTEANLTGADLTGADVMDAAIAGTNFSGADLSGADFTNSDLDAATTDAATTCPDTVPGPCDRGPADDPDVPDVPGQMEGAASSSTSGCANFAQPVADVEYSKEGVGGERQVSMTLCTGKLGTVAREVFLEEYATVYDGGYTVQRQSRSLLFSDGKDHFIVRNLRCDRWYTLTYKDKKGQVFRLWGAGKFYLTCVRGL